MFSNIIMIADYTLKPIAGQKEKNFTDFSVGTNWKDKNNQSRNPTPHLYEPIEKIPNSDKEIYYRSPMKQVLPTKGREDSIIYGRPESSLTGGMVVNKGNMRNEPRGLKTDADRNVEDKVMPIAGFYNPDEVNVLGNL